MATTQADVRSNNSVALTTLAALFFMWGFITCLNGTLIPHLKELFQLTSALSVVPGGFLFAHMVKNTV